MIIPPSVIPGRRSYVLPLRPTGIAWFVVMAAAWILPYGIVPDGAFGEIRTLSAEGEYRLGDRDTKEDGIRMAAEQAKRHALDQVASYLEHVTVVRNFDVTQDEIRSYTAGVVLVVDQAVQLRLDDQTVVVQVALKVQVDTDEVVRALAAVKRHEEARTELSALRREIDRLHQNLDAANRTLAEATAPDQVQKSSREREDLLNRAQSNAMVAQAWTTWMLLVSSPSYPYAGNGGMPQVQALISAAGQLNPANSHLDAMQETMARQPPAPRRPPVPPVPHTVPFLPRMPTYQVVPRPPATTTERAGRPEAGDPAADRPAGRRSEIGSCFNPLPPVPPASIASEAASPSSQLPTLHTWPPQKQVSMQKSLEASPDGMIGGR